MLGRGAYGTVKAGSVAGTAIKKYHGLSLGVYLREVLLLHYLQPHPQVVRLLSYRIEKRELTLERWEQDLWTVVMNNRGSSSERKTILIDVLRALCHVHSCGLVHADVKSANIVVRVVRSEDESPPRVAAALIDYGLASVAPYADVNLTTAPYREPVPYPSWHHDAYSVGIVGLELFANVTWLGPPSHTSTMRVASHLASNSLKRALSGLVTANKEDRWTASQALTVLNAGSVIARSPPPAREETLSVATAAAVERCSSCWHDADMIAIAAGVINSDESGKVERLIRDTVGTLAESLYCGYTRHRIALDQALVSAIIDRHASSMIEQ